MSDIYVSLYSYLYTNNLHMLQLLQVIYFKQHEPHTQQWVTLRQTGFHTALDTPPAFFSVLVASNLRQTSQTASIRWSHLCFIFTASAAGNKPNRKSEYQTDHTLSYRYGAYTIGLMITMELAVEDRDMEKKKKKKKLRKMLKTSWTTKTGLGADAEGALLFWRGLGRPRYPLRSTCHHAEARPPSQSGAAAMSRRRDRSSKPCANQSRERQRVNAEQKTEEPRG